MMQRQKTTDGTTTRVVNDTTPIDDYYDGEEIFDEPEESRATNASHEIDDYEDAEIDDEVDSDVACEIDRSTETASGRPTTVSTEKSVRRDATATAAAVRGKSTTSANGKPSLKTRVNLKANAVINDSFENISSRYDTCIVYALDDSLVRGAYLVFAKWLYGYLNRENLPGSMLVVGFSANSSAATSRISGGANAGTSCVTIDSAAHSATSRGVNLGGSIPVPYVRLDPSDQHAIFDFKRQTGYPAIVVLVTLAASRMEKCLSCDGAILLQHRYTMRRNMTEVAEILQQLNREYLNDLYLSVNSTDRDKDALFNNDDNDNGGNTASVVDCDSAANERGRVHDPNCCATGTARVEFERRDVNEPNLGVSSTATRTKPWLDFSQPMEHYDERNDISESHTALGDATSISIPDEYRQRPLLDSAAVRHAIPCSNNGDGSASGTNGDDGGNREFDATPSVSSRLREQNDRMLQQLQQMDRFLKETHPKEVVPVVSGDTLDLVIDPTAMFRPRHSSQNQSHWR